MKKLLSLIVCAFFLLALVSVPGYSQTAQDILAKYIEAQGGAKALAAIKDTTVSGTMDMVSYGMTGSLTMYQKEPNKMRMDIEVMGMLITQAFDGEIAWMINPQTGATEQMPENMTAELKRQALGNEALLNPEKWGIKYDFTGKEKIDGKEYLVLTQTTADGHVTSMYIDPATYLTYKTKGKTIGQSGEEVMAESVLSDYKKVDGLLVAHSMTTFQDGQEFMRMTITKVAFNAGLEDSLFQMAK
ncbi:MAG: outer membrane lipoprotein-sorting protein [Candidatus Aminicenantales bacterium]